MGEKAAIGVAVPVGLIALLAIAYFVWRRRHTKRTAHPETDPSAPSVPELSGRQVYEMGQQPPELKGSVPAVKEAARELEGTTS